MHPGSADRQGVCRLSNRLPLHHAEVIDLLMQGVNTLSGSSMGYIQKIGLPLAVPGFLDADRKRFR